MRDLINIVTLNEAKKPTKTTTRDDLGFDLMPDLANQSVAKRTAAKSDVTVPGKKSRRRLKAIDLGPASDEASQHFGNLHSAGLEDTMSDDEARRLAGRDADEFDDVEAPHPDTTIRIGHERPRPTTEQLPAIIGKEVAKTGGRVNPEWHQVKHLPNYIQSPIRALGRAVFSQFTDTPIEDIQMIGTIGGINPERDVVGMMAWIKEHGVRDDSAEIDFSQIMPGYTAETSLWRTEYYTFLLVKDFAGYYIYGWAGGRGVHVGQNQPSGLLR